MTQRHKKYESSVGLSAIANPKLSVGHRCIIALAVLTIDDSSRPKFGEHSDRQELLKITISIIRQINNTYTTQT